MAVTTTNRISGPFEGNGTAVQFGFNFKVFLTTDLYVVLTDSSGNLSLLELGTDYTATLNANQDVDAGGLVTMTIAPAVGSLVVITSDVAELQQVVLTNLGGFYPDVLNTVFDRLTILIQQLQVQVNQSIRLGLTDDLDTAQLPPAAQRAGKFLYFGADGSISLVASSPAGTAIFSGPLIGTQDGTNTVFTLTNNGSPIGVVPLQATVWKNLALIPGDANGYTLGPLPGQITYKQAPLPTDSLFASGVFPS